MTATPRRRLQVFGDIHYPPVASRAVEVVADMDRPDGFPDVDHYVTVGDCINSFDSDDDAADAIADVHAFFDALGSPHGGAGGWADWGTTVGNHDQDYRTAARAAELLGMPALNHTVDVGGEYAVIYLYAAVSSVYGPRLDEVWLDAQLTLHADKPCLIVAHPPIYDTTNTDKNGKEATRYNSLMGGYYAVDDWRLRTAIEPHDNVIAWLSGHNHPQPYHDIMVRTTIGASQDILVYNAPSLLNAYPTSPANFLGSALVTISDDGTRADAYLWDHRAGWWYDAVPPLPEYDAPLTPGQVYAPAADGHASAVMLGGRAYLPVGT